MLSKYSISELHTKPNYLILILRATGFTPMEGVKPGGDIDLALEEDCSTPESTWSQPGKVAEAWLRGEGAVGKEESEGPSRRCEGCRLVIGVWSSRERVAMKDQAVDSNMDLRGDGAFYPHVTGSLEKSPEAC